MNFEQPPKINSNESTNPKQEAFELLDAGDIDEALSKMQELEIDVNSEEVQKAAHSSWIKAIESGYPMVGREIEEKFNLDLEKFN